MDNQVKIYYIPNNPNINSGQIYALYINNNTNLDLTSIIMDTNNPNNSMKITIEYKEYNNILNINQKVKEEIKQTKTNIDKFIEKLNIELNNIEKLSNNCYNAIKNITLKGEKNE